MTQGTSEFSFTALMAQRAPELALSLDSDQRALVAQLDALGRRLLAQSAAPAKGFTSGGAPGAAKTCSSIASLLACRWWLSAGCTSTLFSRTASAPERAHLAVAACGHRADDRRLPTDLF